jgi:hypothetical protein
VFMNRACATYKKHFKYVAAALVAAFVLDVLYR